MLLVSRLNLTSQLFALNKMCVLYRVLLPLEITQKEKISSSGLEQFGALYGQTRSQTSCLPRILINQDVFQIDLKPSWPG